MLYYIGDIKSDMGNKKKCREKREIHSVELRHTEHVLCELQGVYLLLIATKLTYSGEYQAQAKFTKRAMMLFQYTSQESQRAELTSRYIHLGREPKPIQHSEFSRTRKGKECKIVLDGQNKCMPVKK